MGKKLSNKNGKGVFLIKKCRYKRKVSTVHWTNAPGKSSTNLKKSLEKSWFKKLSKKDLKVDPSDSDFEIFSVKPFGEPFELWREIMLIIEKMKLNVSFSFFVFAWVCREEFERICLRPWKTQFVNVVEKPGYVVHKQKTSRVRPPAFMLTHMF